MSQVNFKTAEFVTESRDSIVRGSERVLMYPDEYIRNHGYSFTRFLNRTPERNIILAKCASYNQYVILGQVPKDFECNFRKPFVKWIKCSCALHPVKYLNIDKYWIFVSPVLISIDLKSYIIKRQPRKGYLREKMLKAWTTQLLQQMSNCYAKSEMFHSLFDWSDVYLDINRQPVWIGPWFLMSKNEIEMNILENRISRNVLKILPEYYHCGRKIKWELVHSFSFAVSLLNILVNKCFLGPNFSIPSPTNQGTKAIQRNIVNNLTLLSEELVESGLSVDCQLFLKRLLILCPETCMSFKDALNHHWLNLSPVDAHYLSRLQVSDPTLGRSRQNDHENAPLALHTYSSCSKLNETLC